MLFLILQLLHTIQSLLNDHLWVFFFFFFFLVLGGFLKKKGAKVRKTHFFVFVFLWVYVCVCVCVCVVYATLRDRYSLGNVKTILFVKNNNNPSPCVIFGFAMWTICKNMNKFMVIEFIEFLFKFLDFFPMKIFLCFSNKSKVLFIYCIVIVVGFVWHCFDWVGFIYCLLVCKISFVNSRVNIVNWLHDFLIAIS